MIQAGDIVCDGAEYPNDDLGTGGASIFPLSSKDTEFSYGLFDDENLKKEITEPFLVCMANVGPNTNSSQFFINTIPSPHLSGKHVVFGKVISGRSIIRAIERVEIDANEIPIPSQRIRIADCGVWEEYLGIPVYNSGYDQIGGDHFEDLPDDDTHIDHDSTASAYQAALTIKESGTLLLRKGDKAGALYKYRKSLRYSNEYLPDPDDSPDFFKKYSVLKRSLHLNIALINLQLQNYDEVIKSSTYVLEMNKVPETEQAKAYFRRGSAYFKKHNFELALTDLNKANEFIPNNRAIENEIAIVTKAVEIRKQNERKKYAKFFS